MLKENHLKAVIPFFCTIFLLGAAVGNSPETVPVPVNTNVSEAGRIDNPFFFTADISRVRYNGYYLNYDKIEHAFFLNIVHLKNFKNGTLYILYLDKLIVDEPWDQIPEGRENLGYFYVTKDKIYKLSNYNVLSEKENLDVINSISKNEKKFIAQCQLVCQDKATKDIPDKDGWYQFIEEEGDKRTFRHYNDGGGSTWYERLEWQKGKGLILYRSGYGSGRESMEFGL